MRHLITLAFFLGAAFAYFLGFGPLVFGAPVLGWVLVLAGLSIEIAFWRHLSGKRKTVAER
jgi:hypothetical protein